MSKPISRQNGKNAAVNLRITVSQKQKQELEARAMRETGGNVSELIRREIFSGGAFAQAIRTIRKGERRLASFDSAVHLVVSEVDRLIPTVTDGSDGCTTLADWITEGQYNGDETPQSLADEWNELTRQADEVRA